MEISKGTFEKLIDLGTKPGEEDFVSDWERDEFNRRARIQRQADKDAGVSVMRHYPSMSVVPKGAVPKGAVSKER